MRNVMAAALIAVSLTACSQNDKADRNDRGDRGDRREHAGRGDDNANGGRERREHAGRGGGGRNRGGRFDRLDANKDGSINKSEAPARMQSRFDKLDPDGDGKISRDEFTSRGR